MYRSHFSARPGRLAVVAGERCGLGRKVAHEGRETRGCPRRAASNSSSASLPGPKCGATARPAFSASRMSSFIGVAMVISSPTASDSAPYNVIDRQFPPRSNSVPSACTAAVLPNTALGRVLYQLPGQLADPVVVGVRLVGLQHREFRGMRRVDALVAEVPIDLENPLDSADDHSFEVQLRRDPQVEVHIHGVHVGDERPGGGTAVQHLQHRCLDLEKATLVQCRPQRPIHRAAQLDVSACLRSNDQVDIALPDAALLGQRFVRDRQRSQGLRRDGP